MSKLCAIECSVIVKDSEMKLVSKYLKYDPLTLDSNDPEIKRIVNETLSKFHSDVEGELPSVIIKATMVYQ